MVATSVLVRASVVAHPGTFTGDCCLTTLSCELIWRIMHGPSTGDRSRSTDRQRVDSAYGWEMLLRRKSDSGRVCLGGSSRLKLGVVHAARHPRNKTRNVSDTARIPDYASSDCEQGQNRRLNNMDEYRDTMPRVAFGRRAAKVLWLLSHLLFYVSLLRKCLSAWSVAQCPCLWIIPFSCPRIAY
ncbi:hypothetical protein LIA77_04577 [Sarocladium implicatum]|nr:hypothetical protein LIA77_04577 [Sarocladium implicatum]